ncbi:MAG: serine hydrolase [Leucobacter sp.]
MSTPNVSYTLLDSGGDPLRARDEQREYYAASTVKLAVAAALMLRVDAGSVSLEHTINSTSRFASRVSGAGKFVFDADEADPGMPPEGTPVTLEWCMRRMLIVSSNEATNMLVEFVGLDAVNDACDTLGVKDVSMTRLICDYAARDAGFTHTATTHGLARLIWELICGEHFSAATRELMLTVLRAQHFPIIQLGLPDHTRWGSKSGWDDGIRHDVAVIGDPGTPEFRVLSICTEGFTPRGAQELIGVLTRAISPVEVRRLP